MWSTAQRAELMASLGPLNSSAGSQRNIHTSCNSLPSASTALHSTHPFMWSMVPLSLSNPYILRSTLTSPLSKLPTVWTIAPSQIHNSNPNPFPRLPIHISNGLLNLFTLLFSRTMHSTYSNQTHQFPHKLSPVLVFLISVMELPFPESARASRGGCFLLSMHTALWICLLKYLSQLTLTARLTT